MKSTLLHNFTTKIISTASVERQEALKFRDRVFLPLPISVIRLAMIVVRAFLQCARAELSELEAAKGKMSDCRKDDLSRRLNSLLFFWDGVGTAPVLSPIMAPARRT